MPRRRIAAILAAAALAAACTNPADDAAVQVATPDPEVTPAPTPAPPTDPFELATFYDSATPEELGRRLTEAETRLRDPDTPEDEHRDLALVQQAAYRQLVSEAGWTAAVLPLIPEHLRVVVEANVAAGAGLRDMTRPRETLPDWHIVPPPPAQELLAHYRAAEAEFDVPWYYLAAIHLVETRMGRIRGTSVAGARGPMQFMPGTWEEFGEGDIEDARDSIHAAARYLSARGAPRDMPRALFAYNRHNSYVRAITVYAAQMRADPHAFRGYYHWQVHYRTTAGDALLPEGWTPQS